MPPEKAEPETGLEILDQCLELASQVLLRALRLGDARKEMPISRSRSKSMKQGGGLEHDCDFLFFFWVWGPPPPPPPPPPPQRACVPLLTPTFPAGGWQTHYF